MRGQRFGKVGFVTEAMDMNEMISIDLFFQNGEQIVIGLSAMDDERLL